MLVVAVLVSTYKKYISELFSRSELNFYYKTYEKCVEFKHF